MSKYLAELRELENKKNFLNTSNELTLLTKQPKEQISDSNDSNVSYFTENKKNFFNVDIEKIRTWLFKIGEPENDHFSVIDRCRNDPQVMSYFLRHAVGGYEFGYNVTVEADVDDRVRCIDCRYLYAGHCQQWRKTNPHNSRYKPEQKTPKRCLHFKQK